MKIIDYDKEFYKTLIKTARLVPIKPLKWFPPGKLEKFADKKVGEELIFRCKNGFYDEDIANIIKVHLPLDANSHYRQSEDGTLTIQFYKF